MGNASRGRAKSLRPKPVEFALASSPLIPVLVWLLALDLFVSTRASQAQALLTPAPPGARATDGHDSGTGATRATNAPSDDANGERRLAPPAAIAPIERLAPAPQAPPPWANRGRWTFGFQAGYALENAIPRNITHINLLVAQPQVGLIVMDSPSTRLPVHRLEILSEGFLGNAIHPGGRVMGHTLLFRLDGRPYHRSVPLLDFGAGILNTTLDTRAPELTGHLQFTPQGGLGLQYFFGAQRALVFEYRYVHMSNASIRLPNHGFNSSMVTVGFRWLRRPANPTVSHAHSNPVRHPLRYLFGAQ